MTVSDSYLRPEFQRTNWTRSSFVICKPEEVLEHLYKFPMNMYIKQQFMDCNELTKACFEKTCFVNVGWTNRKLIDTCWLNNVESVKMSTKVHFSKTIILLQKAWVYYQLIVVLMLKLKAASGNRAQLKLQCSNQKNLSVLHCYLFVHILLKTNCIFTENPSPPLFIVVCPYLRPLRNAHMLNKLYVQNLHPYYWKCISRWLS